MYEHKKFVWNTNDYYNVKKRSEVIFKFISSSPTDQINSFIRIINAA